MTDPVDVLLIDDDEVDRAHVRRLLDGAYAVREASTAAEGRALAEATPPDLVLLDVRLPDADGPTLLPWFVERGLPVVMLTGVEDAEVVVEAMQGGAADYLVKGRMDAGTLGKATRAAVETAALRREVAAQQARLAEQAAALEVANREARELAAALTLAEQAERRRISSLLHDHVQQLLFGAQFSVQALRRLATDDRAEADLDRAHDALAQSIEATRTLTLDLTPPVLDDEDYSVALRWLGDHVERQHGLAVDVVAEGSAVVRRREVRVLLTELVRELLFNVVKHAGTDRARVRLDGRDGTIAVSVEDGGAGFDPALLDGAGFGLYSVRGRLELLGGRLDLESVPGRGTRATIEIAQDPDA
ncbi:response regulator [Rubrivirga sp. S365]|uniref:hybrid sensor histidine kinase/response regulator n=1 Tax=Rubrivirga sp. S365 TaxID=3076080 RepID=UPI0028C52310|nr:response regulator [Rubrivirga sp. S365]MDT7855401.1 response regulator [Rubrivirga sp. S365]